MFFKLLIIIIPWDELKNASNCTDKYIALLMIRSVHESNECTEVVGAHMCIIALSMDSTVFYIEKTIKSSYNEWIFEIIN